MRWARLALFAYFLAAFAKVDIEGEYGRAVAVAVLACFALLTLPKVMGEDR